MSDEIKFRRYPKLDMAPETLCEGLHCTQEAIDATTTTLTVEEDDYLQARIDNSFKDIKHPSNPDLDESIRKKFDATKERTRIYVEKLKKQGDLSEDYE